MSCRFRKGSQKIVGSAPPPRLKPLLDSKTCDLFLFFPSSRLNCSPVWIAPPFGLLPRFETSIRPPSIIQMLPRWPDSANFGKSQNEAIANLNTKRAPI